MYEDFNPENINNMQPPARQNSNSIPVVKDGVKEKNVQFVLILCAICALAGALIGGITSGLIVKSSIKSESVMPETQQNVTVSTTVQPQTTTQKTEDSTIKKSEETTIQSGMFTSSDDKPSLDFTFEPTDIYKYNVDSVVSIEVSSGYSKGYGTGFIVSEAGYIVTNYHVVEDAKSVYVTLYDESTYSAEVIGYEESNDLAVIKIEPKGTIESLIYGKSSDLEVGDDVYVIGNPLGDLTFTLTTGVVSALNRLIDTGSGFTINMFQTDAAINSGNSGGPVFDEHGYVVGIASAKYAAASIEGLSFCVPIDDVRSMIDEIINKGYVSGKPVIGVSVYDKEITNYGFIQSQRSINGAKVAEVGNGTPAQKAGIQKGDIIVEADGETIVSVSQLRTVLSDYRSGDTIKLKLSRQGSYVEVNIVLDEYEPSSPRTNYDYIYDL